MTSVINVSAGTYHSVALKSDGTVWTWGSNAYGQLGDGTNNSQVSPVKVQSLSSIISVKAGLYHTVSLKSDGTVWTWGNNAYGQLGDGTTTSRLTPTQAKNISSVIAIAASSTMTIAVKSDGTVWYWGSYGSTRYVYPTQVPNLGDALEVFSGKSENFFVINKNGTVWAWGNNMLGELGTTGPSYTSIEIPNFRSVKHIVAGSDYTIAVKDDGSVWGWGNNLNGQMSERLNKSRILSPTRLENLEASSFIGIGNNFNAILRIDGSAWTWGNNSFGQLGNGTAENSASPVQVVFSNKAPVVDLLFPTGTQTSPSTINITRPIIEWKQTDIAFTNFTAFKVQILDELGEIIVDSGEKSFNTSLTNSSWLVSSDLPKNQKLQIRIKVKDENEWSEWSDVRWIQVNSGSIFGNNIFGGLRHSVELKNDGTVWTWGDNRFGQLGDGTTNSRSTKEQIPNMDSVVSITAGEFSTTALKSDGTVWAWGQNDYGQLGDGTSTKRLIPVQVTGLSSVIAIASMSYNVAVLKEDGTVWTWGKKQLGNGSITIQPPIQVTGLNSVIAISAGLALKSDGTVWSWGNGSESTQIPITSVSKIFNHNFAMKNDGTVWAWGDNQYGQLGIGNTTTQTNPVQIHNLSSISMIVAGGLHSLAVKSDGTVWAWGYNGYGQIGNGTTTQQLTPVKINGLASVSSIAGGVFHSLAYMKDGTVRAWGANESGQLGDGTIINRNVPVQVVANRVPVAVLSYPMGTNNSPTVVNIMKPTVTWSQTDDALTKFVGFQVQVLDENGTNIILDSGVQKQDSTASNANWMPLSNLPIDQKMQIRVKVSDGFLWSDWSEARWILISSVGSPTFQVSSGYKHSIALMNDGIVWGWGDNTYGQLGDGTKNSRSTSVQVSNLDSIVGISAGYMSTSALKKDGTVWTWGQNATAPPAQVTGLTSVIAISSGNSHFVALKEDGTVWSWGNNGQMQLGDGTTISRGTPVQVLGLNSVTAIAAGTNFTLALKSDGTVWSWGNSKGIAQIPNLTSVKSIFTSSISNHSFAIKSDGTVWAWGDNSYGQLGIGSTSTTPITNPVQVTTLNSVSMIATGNIHSLAVKTDGTVWAWGSNGYGGLGDGTTTQRLTPVQVTNLTSISSIAGGVQYSLAYKTDGTVWAWGINDSGQLGDGTVINRSVPVRVVANRAPVATLTYPLGTESSPTSVNILNPAITWIQTDDAITKFVSYQVQVLDETGTTVIVDSGVQPQNTTSSSTSWVTLNSLPRNHKMQVRVKVSDGFLWSEWSDVRWIMTSETKPSGNKVFSGQNYSAAVMEGGTVWSWGSNQSTAVQVPNLVSVVGVSSMAALMEDGTVWNWGQIGAVPAKVTGLQQVIAIASGKSHYVALKEDGTIWTWGYNEQMQLGDGTTTSRTIPIQVVGLNSVIKITAGTNFTLALKSDGTVWSWGNNKGIAQVPNLISVKDIFTGALSNHSFAVKNDGTVWAWGDNQGGQLGMGSTSMSPYLNPAHVPNLNSIKIIATGDYYSLAIKTDGTVWAWGSNGYGVLGDGTTTQRLMPVKVSGISSVDSIAGGVNVSIANKSDGTVWSWGLNSYGQLGDGTTINRSIPVQVVTNKAPIVVLSSPLGTKSSPTVINITKSAITWTQTDHALTKFVGYQVQMLDETGTTILLDSGVQAQSTTASTASWMPPTNLPLGMKMQVRVKVNDGYLWSDWSESGWIQVNNISPSGYKISGGAQHSAAVMDDGKVWAWGGNTYGQLGDGTTAARSTKVQVQNLDSVAGISSGYYFTAALKEDGTVWTWGLNSSGQLGDGTTTNRLLPVKVSGLNSVIAITSGSYHVAALKEDGTVWTWGKNDQKQLGDGTVTQRSIPIQVWGLNSVVAIAAGTNYTLALKSDGTVWSWGNDLGLFQVPNLTLVKNIFTSSLSSHNFALKSDGTIWAWGDNQYGQFGIGSISTTSVTNPIQVPNLNSIRMIATGNVHSLAIKTDGTVWSWGHNGYGQIGDGTTTQRLTPVQVSGLDSVSSITGGAQFSLAYKNDGTVWSWGYNDSGRLGDGTTINRSTPVQVIENKAPEALLTYPYGTESSPTVFNFTKPTITWMQTDEAFTRFANFQIQVLDETGSTIILDSGVQTQNTMASSANWTLLNNLPINQKMQVRVRVSDGILWSKWSEAKWIYINIIVAPVPHVAGGRKHSVAVMEDGNVWTWGDNTFGQLGDGTTTARSMPIQVPNLSSVIGVSTGFNFTTVLKEDGTVWTWGQNIYGQIGDGTKTNRLVPVQVNGLTSVIAIASGYNHVVALKEDGTVWAWGSNGQKELGDGTTNNRTTPIQVPGVDTVIAIAAGTDYTLVLKSDGTVWSWGSGSGITQVPNLTLIKGITTSASGGNSNFALKSDGTVWGWGNNYYGQLGTGNTSNYPLTPPIQIPNLSSITMIAVGSTHTLAVKSDGTVWGLGSNSYGELGDGTTTQRLTPVRISGLNSVSSIAGGAQFSIAIKNDGTVWMWGNNDSGQLGIGMIGPKLVPTQVVIN